MSLRNPQRGAVLLAVTAIFAIAFLAALSAAVTRSAAGPGRHAVTDQALATAREAPIAYAASRPIDDIVGPGYLRFPDFDEHCWAEPTCG